jgi:hypothetical protein
MGAIDFRALLYLLMDSVEIVPVLLYKLQKFFSSFVSAAHEIR